MKKNFRPDWSEEEPKPGPYRAIAKYGDPNYFKHPSDGWVKMFQQEFGMSDADFSRKVNEGHEKVVLNRPSELKPDQIEALKSIVGKEQMDVLRALKRHFDPNSIMNPGGQLGLDDIPARR